MTIALLDRQNIEDATRRQFLTGAAAAALLAGCGRTEPAEPAAPADGGFPVTIEHRYGSTMIPARPERVASVGIREPDFVLALGVTPLTVTDYHIYPEAAFAAFPWAAPLWGAAVPEVLPETPLPFERIAALRPDVILGTSAGMDEETFGLLSEIAPTVAPSAAYRDFSTPWREELRAIASVLGETTRAEELIAGVEADATMIRTRYPQFVGAVAGLVNSPFEGNMRLYVPGTAPLAAFDLLGLAGTPVTGLERTNAFFSFSVERLDILDDHDLIFWPLYVEGGRAEAEAIPLYPELRVAREGRVVFLDDPVLTAAQSASSVLSLPFLIDRLSPMLAAALDGDPATEVP